MKNITLKAFHNMVYAEYTKLYSVERLLNQEGRETLSCCWELLNAISFYETIEEFAQEGCALKLLERHSHCNDLQPFVWILEQVAGE